MGRSGYSDELDNWDLIRWRGRVASAIRGKRGQAFLSKLLASLDAMPSKRLIAEEIEADGDVCALGSVALAERMDATILDPEDHDGLGATFNISPCLVQEIEWVNDESGPWHCTPEQRFEAVRKWVVSKIKSDHEPAVVG